MYKSMLARFSMLVILSFPMISYAQEDISHTAPTLQIGLDGLSFSKGALDKELILEIVAQKQQDIKLKAVQNMLLGKMEGSGGTLYSYVDNIIRCLVVETDQHVRTRRILENTVNVSFVYAFADYYMKSLPKTGTRRKSFEALRKEYISDKEFNPAKGIAGVNSIHWDPASAPWLRGDNEVLGSTGSSEMMALLIDMAGETVRRDSILKDLGLFQISYSAIYDYLNEFIDLESYDADKCEGQKDCPCKEGADRYAECLVKEKRFNLANSVFKDMRDQLGELTRYVGLVHYMVNELSYRNNRTNFKAAKSLETGVSSADWRAPLDSALDEIDKAIKSLAVTNVDTSVAKDINSLSEIRSYLRKARKFCQQLVAKSNPELTVLADIIYTVRAELVPTLKSVVPRAGNLLKATDDLIAMNTIFVNYALDKLPASHPLKEIKLGSLHKLIGTLYQFNRAETFSEYLKITNDLASLFPENEIKDALSTVVSFVKDYTVIKRDDNGKEVVGFNVENFIVKLQTLRTNRLRRLQFLFTVGVNSIYFRDKLYLNEGRDTVSNFSFVGEKIGLKFKLIDWAFSRTRNPGEAYQINNKWYNKIAAPREPLVSNFHVLLYGSGLLYNLTNLRTDKNFDAPIVGGGIGVTFVNSMDLNFTLGIPLQSSKSFLETREHYFAGIGFDIQFGEYLDRLNKKRQLAKTEKLLKGASSQ